MAYYKERQFAWLGVIEKLDIKLVARAADLTHYRFNLIGDTLRDVIRAVCPDLTPAELLCALDLFRSLNKAAPRKRYNKWTYYLEGQEIWLRVHGHSLDTFKRAVRKLRAAYIIGTHVERRGQGRGSRAHYFVPSHTSCMLHLLSATTMAISGRLKGAQKGLTGSFFDALQDLILTDRDGFLSFWRWAQGQDAEMIIWNFTHSLCGKGWEDKGNGMNDYAKTLALIEDGKTPK